MARRRPLPTKGGPSASSAVDRATGVAEQRLAVAAEPIAEELIAAALSGDISAARLVLDKALHKPADRRISYPLPQILNKRDAELAMMEVLSATAKGHGTPAEAHVVIKQLVEFIRAPSAAVDSIFIKAVKGDFDAMKKWFQIVEERLKALTGPSEDLAPREAKAVTTMADDEQSGASTLTAPDRATTAAERRLEGAASAIVEVVIAAAMTGDMAAQKLVLDKALREPADRPISFPIRRIESKEDVLAAKADVFEGIRKKQITPAEADAFHKLLDAVLSTPEVPTEAIDSEQLEETMQWLIPKLRQHAIDKEYEQPGTKELTPYEIWLKTGEYFRAVLLDLVQPGARLKWEQQGRRRR